MIDEDALFAALLAEEGFDNTDETNEGHNIGDRSTDELSTTHPLTYKSLTDLQQGLVFWQYLHPQSPAYTVSRVWRLHIPFAQIDAQQLRNLLQGVAVQQPSLRARIEHEPTDSKAQFAFNEQLKIEVLDLRAKPLDDAAMHAQQIAQTNSETSLPITQYLCRVTLIALPSQQWQLGVDFHHLITDAWSGEVWLTQITQAFEQLIAQSDSEVPAPVQQLFPADAIAQHAAKHVTSSIDHLPSRWQHALGDILSAQQHGADLLQGDKLRPSVWQANGKQQRRAIPSALIAKLQEFSRQQRCSAFHPLLSMWMHAAATLRDKVNSPMLCAYAQAERPPNSENTINCWIHTKVALLTDLASLSLRDSIAQLKQVPDTEVPTLPQVLRCANPERYADQQALSHLHFNIEINNASANSTKTETSLASGGQKVQLTDKYVRFDLSLDAYIDGDNGQWIIGYRTDLFSESFIDELLTRFESLITQALAQPDTPLQQLWPIHAANSSVTNIQSQRENQKESNVQPFPTRRRSIAAAQIKNVATAEQTDNMVSALVGLRDCIALIASEQAIDGENNTVHSGLTKCVQLLQTGADLTEHSWFSLGLDSVTLLRVAHAFNAWLTSAKQPAGHSTPNNSAPNTGHTSAQYTNSLTPIALAHFYHSPSIGHFIEHYACH